MQHKSLIRILTGLVLLTSFFSLILPAQAKSMNNIRLVETTVAPVETTTATPTSGDCSLLTVSDFSSNAQSGIPGSVVQYAFTVSNPSAGEVTAALSAASTSSWTPGPSLSQSNVTLAAGDSKDINMNVPIPATATAGQNDIQTVTVTCGSFSKSITATTTAKAPAVPGRPQLLVSSYYVNSGRLGAGSTFDQAVVLQNSGGGTAYNVVIVFDGGTGFYPQGTGGVRSTSSLGSGSSFTAIQTFLGASELAWTPIEVIKATVTYSDAAGTAYTDTFSLTQNVSVSGGSYATATPVSSNHAQIVVTGYKTDVDLLQPGTTFDLNLDIKNMGSSDALGVTMILGGGAGSTTGASGTPQPGGVSGSSGELTNFAPLNSSNLTYLGDVKQNISTSVSQRLIVNTTTQPGVYTLKISFVYTNSKGVQVTDDQVITLLVYSLPQVQIDFYRDPGVFTAQSMSVLPLQVTNLGKKQAVLGNMKVTADGADITNNVSLVGALDPGGYYTLDANITPQKEGPMDLDVVINYTDDFNASRTVEQKIHIEVQPAIEITPEGTDTGINGGKDGGMGGDTGAPETIWHKIGRFLKGMFGLDSGNGSQVTPAATESAPIQSYPLPGGKG
jgi:CARDB.